MIALTINRHIKNIFYLLKIENKLVPKLKWWSIGFGLLNESGNIISMLLPAIVLSFLLQEERINYILLFILGTNIILYFINITREYVSQEVENTSLMYDRNFIGRLNNKWMHVPLITAQKKEAVELYDKAIGSASELSDTGFQIYHTIISKLFIVGITMWESVKISDSIVR